VRNFVWLLVGIQQSRSVTLSKIAGKIPGEAKLLSTVRRLGRFLSNPAIRVRDWYEPIASAWLTAQFRHLGEIRLIVDGTKIGSQHQLLIVCLCYRKRALPIAWTWVVYVRGHSSARKQLALLAYVRSLIPVGAVVFLVGDREFGAVDVPRQLNRWQKMSFKLSCKPFEITSSEKNDTAKITLVESIDPCTILLPNWILEYRQQKRNNGNERVQR